MSSCIQHRKHLLALSSNLAIIERCWSYYADVLCKLGKIDCDCVISLYGEFFAGSYFKKIEL